MTTDTTLTLNPRHPEHRKILRTPRTTHAWVEELHGLGNTRVLWRAEGGTITVRSDAEPDLRRVTRDQPDLILEWDTQAVEAPASGDYRFVLTTNPTRRARDGYRIPLSGWDESVAWLQRQGRQHGFTIPVNLEGNAAVRVLSSKLEKFSHDEGREVTQRVVTFGGVLTVTDEEKFAAVLRDGLGRGKAYGLGLLTVQSV